MTFTIGLDTSGLNPAFKEHSIRGIGRYIFELTRYFDSYSSPDFLVRPFRTEDFLKEGGIDSLIQKFPLGRQTIRQQLLLPLQINAKMKGNFDILHFPAHMDPPSWSLKKYIVTVLDLIPLVYSEMYKADKPSWRFHLARWLEIRAIKNASHIVAISNNTAKDVHEILGIPYEKISVTHLGAAEVLKNNQCESIDIRAHYKIPSNVPLVLYVGGIDQRKNMRGMIESFKHVVEHFKSNQKTIPYLVLAGQISQDRQYPILKALIRSNNLEPYIVETGFVPDEHLGSLFKTSSVFFFPSLYEGFGLPPLEAMAAGLPVVSSSTSCMPEILGSAGILVDPKNYEAFGQALVDILQNQSLADNLREKGLKQAALFTWQKTGEATAAVYEKMSKAHAL